MPARLRPKPTRRTQISVRSYLTASEVRKLRAMAATDLRSIAGLTASRVVESLERPHLPRRGVPGASAGDKREPFSVNIRLSISQAQELRGRARAEMRSVSGYVARVLVEVLAQKR